MPENSDENFVENSQYKNVENIEKNVIINYKEQEIFDVNLLPEQIHHFATNKNKKYTPQFNELVGKYGLKLDQPWNKETMRHRSKHPRAYHDYVLYKMKACDLAAKGDVEVFINEFENVKKKIIDNPFMLRKAFWEGKDYEILFDEI